MRQLVDGNQIGETHAFLEMLLHHELSCGLEMVARADHHQVQAGNSRTGERYRLDRDIQAEPMGHGAVASQGESTVGAVARARQGGEDGRVGGVHHRPDLVLGDSRLDEAHAMRRMHRQHRVGEARADALLLHQQPRGDRAAPAPKLVLIELGHRVVDVEYDLAPEKAGRKRA